LLDRKRERGDKGRQKRVGELKGKREKERDSFALFQLCVPFLAIVVCLTDGLRALRGEKAVFFPGLKGEKLFRSCVKNVW